MANGHGGKRIPANPAPVSGPGALSRRTDGQVQSAPTGMNYGDHAQLMAQESTAPMAGTPNVPNINLPATPTQASQGKTANGAPLPQGKPVTNMYAPTNRPSEHIMTGTDFGPGAGSEVLPVEHTQQFQQSGPMTQMLSQLSAGDSSGQLAGLLSFARNRNA